MADNFLISTGAGPSAIRAVDISSDLYVPVHVGSPYSDEVTSTTVTTTEYTLGDVVDTKLTFSNVNLATGRGVKLVNATLLQTTVATVGTPTYDVVFFNQDLTTTTPVDNTALNITSPDLVNVESYISFVNKVDVGGGSIFSVTPNIILTPNTTNLYAVIRASSTFTLGSITSTGIKLVLQLEQL